MYEGGSYSGPKRKETGVWDGGGGTENLLKSLRGRKKRALFGLTKLKETPAKGASPGKRE